MRLAKTYLFSLLTITILLAFGSCSFLSLGSSSKVTLKTDIASSRAQNILLSQALITVTYAGAEPEYYNLDLSSGTGSLELKPGTGVHVRLTLPVEASAFEARTAIGDWDRVDLIAGQSTTLDLNIHIVASKAVFVDPANYSIHLLDPDATDVMNSWKTFPIGDPTFVTENQLPAGALVDAVITNDGSIYVSYFEGYQSGGIVKITGLDDTNPKIVHGGIGALGQGVTAMAYDRVRNKLYFKQNDGDYWDLHVLDLDLESPVAELALELPAGVTAYPIEDGLAGSYGGGGFSGIAAGDNGSLYFVGHPESGGGERLYRYDGLTKTIAAEVFLHDALLYDFTIEPANEAPILQVGGMRVSGDQLIVGAYAANSYPTRGLIRTYDYDTLENREGSTYSTDADPDITQPYIINAPRSFAKWYSLDLLVLDEPVSMPFYNIDRLIRVPHMDNFNQASFINGIQDIPSTPATGPGVIGGYFEMGA